MERERLLPEKVIAHAAQGTDGAHGRAASSERQKSGEKEIISESKDLAKLPTVPYNGGVGPTLGEVRPDLLLACSR